jgi:hypothetical protein
MIGKAIQAAGVIEVPVTQSDDLSTLQVHPQRLGIVLKDATLPRVEKDSPGVCLDPERQSMFGKDVTSARGVLSQYRDSKMLDQL